MKVHGVVWVGTRTDAFDETVAFFRTVMGVDLNVVSKDFAWSRMPNTSQLEVFGPGDRDHLAFTTGPVPEFLVDDVDAATEELRAAGVELLGGPVVEADGAWVHFRAPDGNVYGLTAASTYRR
jgi:predicted enzyme related to lactoylglutathione lyase